MEPKASDFNVEEQYDLARVHIRARIDPISLQADAKRKRAFRGALSQAVRSATKGVFVHDVEVRLVWYVDEKRRYQTHLIADLDNVMKPVLDAVTGPDGVLIDDNQIQSIRASWMTPGSPGPGFDLTFEALMSSDYVKRQGLRFVEFSADRCYVLPGAVIGHEDLVVDGYRRLVDAFRRQLAAGVVEDVARTVLPIARPFPRARLARFSVHHEQEFPFCRSLE